MKKSKGRENNSGTTRTKQEFQKSGLSLKGRILLVILPIIIITIPFTMMTTFRQNEKTIVEEVCNVITSSTEASANKISISLGGVLKELEGYRVSIQNGDLNKEQIKRIVDSTYEVNDLYPLGVYYSDSNGTWIDGSGWQPDADYVPKEQSWFIEGEKNTEGFALGEVYHDSATGEYVVTAGTNISGNGGTTTILAADIPLTSMIEYVKGLSLFDGKGGYLLVTSDQQIIAATTMDEAGNLNVDQNTQTLYTKLSENAYLDTIQKASILNVGGRDYYVAAHEIEGCNWNIVSYVLKEDAVLSDLKASFIQIAIRVFFIILAAAVIAERFINHKTRQISNTVASIERITQGDFTEQMKITSHDELGLVSFSLQEFLLLMKDMLFKLRQMMQMMTTQSDQSTLMSHELTNASSSQVEALQEMINTLSQMSNSVEEIAQESTTLANNVSSTNERCKLANHVLMETVSIALSGKKEMTEVGLSMKEIHHCMDELSEAVKEVEQNMSEITHMVDVIGDIAGQTNLLSLNASIEAARAGEAGRGFAVVAQQIGNLADSSAKSVIDIKEITESIGKQVGKMTGKMLESIDSINQCSQIVEKTNQTFGSINDKVMDTKQEVTAIIGSVEQLDTISQSLAAITEEQSASSEEMLATSENVLGHSEQVKDDAKQAEESATALKEIVNDLEKLLAFFKY